MSKIKILGLFIPAALLFFYPSAGGEEINLLSGRYTTEKIKEILIPATEWHPFPRASEREGWEGIPEKVRAAHIRRAENFLDGDWETPKVSVFLEYVRNGNRSNFQSVSFGRRAQLAELVLGECMEGKGRFLDDVLNGVWTICEETYWGVPAHVGAQKRGSGLPDVTEPTVDLFAAETGMLLAWTYYLLGEELAEISPLVGERIRYEVDRRIIDVNLERDDFWWMGFSGRTVNNWNPWICSNWLAAVLILEDDPERQIDSVSKILRCLDNFLNPYPRDGGCDEGPGYWDRAGGSFFDCLELLSSASGGAIDVFDEPLVREIGKYIYRVYISDRYFINFADAAAKLTANAGVIFRYGKSIGDEAMIGFGAFLAEQQDLGDDYIRGNFGWLGRVLPALFHLGELLKTEAREPLARDFWFEELQVMGARSYEGSNKSFYVAAKGGHNAESHNHNDIGNFIVYADGHPILIDIGVETYTAKTFSSQRYEIWTMQSAYHNLPTINGVMQKDGKDYKAGEISYASDDKTAVFSLDLAQAYPEEAKVDSWTRTVTLNRGKNVIIHDQYTLEEIRDNLQMTLMSWCEPESVAEGRIKLSFPKQAGDLMPVYLHFDKDKLDAEIEKISLEDERLRSSWGNWLYRIVLTATDKLLEDTFSLRIDR
jgi:hypothetical protein